MSALCSTCFGAGCKRCERLPRAKRQARPEGHRSKPTEPSWWPRGEHGQPLLPNGTVDVRKLCAELDERYNRGLPEPKR